MIERETPEAYEVRRASDLEKMYANGVELRLKPGDVIKCSSPLVQLFEKESDWSKWIQGIPGMTATIIIARKRLTGAGRLWHKLLVNVNGDPIVRWTPSSGGWDHVDVGA